MWRKKSSLGAKKKTGLLRKWNLNSFCFGRKNKQNMNTEVFCNQSIKQNAKYKR